MENHSSIGILVSFSLLTSTGSERSFKKSSARRKFTNKLKRCCLFLMLWKNKQLSKWTRALDCPLSSLEQIHTIPRYISFTHCVNNGYNLILGRVNFITVLNHSLYISFALKAVMNDVVFITKRAYFMGVVDSQALHQFDRIITVMMF